MKSDEDLSKYYLFIENTMYESSSLTREIGDIFLTDKGLYFIDYAFINLGVPPWRINEEKKRAFNQAKDKRETQYGLSLSDQLEKNEGSIFIPRAKIILIAFNDKEDKLIVNGVNKQQMFNVPDIEKVRKIFESYLSDKAIPIYDDIHGKNLQYPSPYKTLDLILNNDIGSKLSDDKFLLMAKNARYIYGLFYLIMEKNSSEKSLIYKEIAKAPKYFSLAINEVTKKTKAKDFQKILGALGIIILFILVGIVSIKVGDSGGIIWGVISGLCVIGGFLGLIRFAKSFNEKKYLQSILNKNGID